MKIRRRSFQFRPEKTPVTVIEPRLSSKRMHTTKAELADFSSLKDLKSILSSRAPCVSVYMALASAPTNQRAKANALRWKECVRTLEPKIQQNGSEARELLQSISDWDAISGEEKPGAKSIAVFRSPDVFCVMSLQEQVKGKAVVGPHFNVRPLLPELTRDNAFHI